MAINFGNKEDEIPSDKKVVTLSRTSFNYEADPKVEELLKCVQEKTIDLTKKLVEHKEKIIKEVARGEFGRELTPEDYPDFSLKRIERTNRSPMVDNWYEEIWYKKKLLGTIVYNFGIGPFNSKLMESTMEVKFIPPNTSL